MVKIDVKEKQYNKLKMAIELLDLKCSVDEMVNIMIDESINEIKLRTLT